MMLTGALHTGHGTDGYSRAARNSSILSIRKVFTTCFGSCVLSATWSDLTAFTRCLGVESFLEFLNWGGTSIFSKVPMRIANVYLKHVIRTWRTVYGTFNKLGTRCTLPMVCSIMIDFRGERVIRHHLNFWGFRCIDTFTDLDEEQTMPIRTVWWHILNKMSMCHFVL